MGKTLISKGISKESVREMLLCFQPVFKSFKSKETIVCYSDKIQKLGIIISGTAKLYSINTDGEYSLLEEYFHEDIFGELFCLPLENFEYIVEANTDCKVMFIDYSHLTTPCSKTCAHHSQLINNLFWITAEKSQTLFLHINILSQHTIRRKLLAYLQYIQSVSGSNTFVIPMSLVSLSEYLCVDRSAMMREMQLLKKEGVFKSSGCKFTF